MCINSGPKRQFVYQDDKIEIIEEFKYLGFVVSRDGKLDRGVNERAEAAERAYFSLMRFYRGCKGMTIPDVCYLFTSLVESVMLYACEIWGTVKCKKMEEILLRFCKTILRVPNTCSTAAVYGELGRSPIYDSSRRRAISYLNRLMNREAPPLSKAAVMCSGLSKKSLINRILHVGLSPHQLARQSLNDIDDSFLEGQKDCVLEDFETSWKKDIQRTTDARGGEMGNKLRFYKRIKKYFGMEPYLHVYLKLPVKQRVVLTRFRTSCHNLEIEPGRHHRPYIPPEHRLCRHCNGQETQDEVHHLFRCANFDRECAKMYEELEKFVLKLSFRSEEEMLNILFCSGDRRVYSALANFLLSTADNS